MSQDKSVDIDALAMLARLEIPQNEKAALAAEIPAILSFVEAIQKVSAETNVEPVAGEHRNIMREDTNPHEPGMYTEELLAAAPEREGSYVKVKQVITGGKHAAEE